MNNENNELVKNILNRTFFSSWKNKRYSDDEYNYGNYSSLELQINAACNLNCKYCYYAKYSKDLYPAKISKPEMVLNNLDSLLRWLSKNQYYPRFEIFSGEPFVQPIGFMVLEKLIDWHIDESISGQIIVPSNFSFLMSDEKTAEVERLLIKGKKNNVVVGLSASIDGKYWDDNRPFKDGSSIRTDEYYDTVFEFAKKWGFSFHPMIYNENIEKSIDNFLWFQENFEKYDLPWQSIYFLEVRNVEWSKHQLQEFYKFIRYLVNWVYNKSGVSPNDFPEYTFNGKTFNLFNMFTQMGRGIGCSIQSAMQLRLGDLTTTLCHRNSYEGQNLFKFVSKDNEIVDIEALNYSMMVSMYSLVAKNLPWCENCTINNLCSGQCLGSMREVNGDPFIPIPTVCALEHAKVAAILDEIDALGLFTSFYDFTSKKDDMRIYKKYFKGDR